MTSKYCECGNEIKIRLHPVRNPNSHKRHSRTLKDHDLCRQCFRKVMMQERLKQRRAG